LAADIINKLYTRFEGNSTFLYTDLFLFIQKEYPGVAHKTIDWKIYELKSKGILVHISRGIYSLQKKGEFTPELTPNLKRIYHRVKKELPYINFCVWDSRWFNEFMVNQIFKYYIVVETEKDTTDSVFNILTDFSKNVFLKPDKEIFQRYIINFDEVVIVKPLISEAPLLEIENIKVPTIEKLLVDCLIDHNFFAAQQDELNHIFQTVFQNYLINLNKMKRYARRRNQLNGLENKIERLS
jgi:hypothetical protein